MGLQMRKIGHVILGQRFQQIIEIVAQFPIGLKLQKKCSLREFILEICV